MNPIEDLINISKNGTFVAVNTANKALKYQKYLDRNEISLDEYEELMLDLISEKNLARFADDLETQIKIEQAVSALIMITKSVV